MHDVFVTIKCEGVFASRRVPEFDHLLVRTRRVECACRADRHVAHPLRVPGQSFHAVTAGHLPHFDCGVARARHYVVARWRERHARDVVVVSGQGLQSTKNAAEGKVTAMEQLLGGHQ